MSERTDECAVGRYLAAIEQARMGDCDVLNPDVLLDATVPNWRYSVRGNEAVRTELSRWYGNAGTFEELTRTELPSGELVEFSLRWEEDVIPHAVHQAHILRQQVLHTVAEDGVRMATAKLHQMIFAFRVDLRDE